MFVSNYSSLLRRGRKGIFLVWVDNRKINFFCFFYFGKIQLWDRYRDFEFNAKLDELLHAYYVLGNISCSISSQPIRNGRAGKLQGLKCSREFSGSSRSFQKMMNWVEKKRKLSAPRMVSDLWFSEEHKLFGKTTVRSQSHRWYITGIWVRCPHWWMKSPTASLSV